ncbi:hypothetical protein Hanom_Chr00s156113g01823691 [Helianthus anomalus]
MVWIKRLEVEEFGVSPLHANMVDVEVAMQHVETSTSGGALPEADGLSFRLQDPLVNLNYKEKKRGCLRKKTRGDKSQSPTGEERPKKRARDDDDPYDIDRFIFNVQGGHEAPMDNSGVNVEFNQKVRFEGVSRGDEVGGVVDQTVTNENSEVQATVALASSLGVENISGYEASIRSLVDEEGFQSVIQ